MVTKIVNPVLNLLSPAVDGALFADDIDMGGNVIEGLPLTPTANDQAASKFYVDQVAATAGGGVFLPGGFGPIPWSGTAVPAGWLLCDGASYSTATFPDLFASIGYTYGGGGGSFNVPDMRGIVPAGMDNMNPLGSVAGPGGNIVLSPSALGDFTGSETHTLLIAQIPIHDHGGGSFASSGHTHDHAHTHSIGSHTHSLTINANTSTTNCNFSGGGVFVATGGHAHGGTADASTGNTGAASTATTGAPSSSSSISPEGSGQAHNNVQPTRFFGYIIKSSDATLAFPGDILMAGNRITGLPTPTASNEAATKGYVDSQIANNATYDVALFVGGFITLVGKEVARFPAVRGFTIASGFGNSQASCRVAPTGGSAVFDIRKQGSGVFGTITFTIGSLTGSFVVTNPALLTFFPGEVLRVTAQTADPGQEDIGITIEALL